MPKVLPEYLEQRRQQIVDGAAACFSRRGFHQTTMQDICDECSLSPGAVYRYFSGKDEIIQAMCDRGRREDTELIRTLMSEGDTLTVLGGLIDAFIGGIEHREACALMLELTAEAGRDPMVLEQVQKSRSTILEPLMDFVRQAQSRGEFAPDLDPEAIARVMMSIYLGLVVQKLTEPDTDPSLYAEAVRALFAGSFWCGAKPAIDQAKLPKLVRTYVPVHP